MASELAPRVLNLDLALSVKLFPWTPSASKVLEGITERKLVGERIAVLPCYQGSPQTCQMCSIGSEGRGPEESEDG